MLIIEKKKQKKQEPLDIGEKVLVLAEKLKKKDAPGVLFKSITQKIHKTRALSFKQSIYIMNPVFIYFDVLTFNNQNKFVLKFSQEKETKKAYFKKQQRLFHN